MAVVGVIGFEVVVANGPFRKDVAVMLHLAEILRAHAEQRRTVDFRVAADVVVNAGVERAPVLVTRGFLSLVLVVDEEGLGTPVPLLARQIAATFYEEAFLPGRCQPIGERFPARTGIDNDHITMCGHTG